MSDYGRFTAILKPLRGQYTAGKSVTQDIVSGIFCKLVSMYRGDALQTVDRPHTHCHRNPTHVNRMEQISWRISLGIHTCICVQSQVTGACLRKCTSQNDWVRGVWFLAKLYTNSVHRSLCPNAYGTYSLYRPHLLYPHHRYPVPSPPAVVFMGANLQ